MEGGFLDPTDGVHQDIGFHHNMLSQLILNHVRFNPYHLYPVWDELETKLTNSI